MATTTTKKLAGQKKRKDRTSAAGRTPDREGFPDRGRRGAGHNRGDNKRGGHKRGRSKGR